LEDGGREGATKKKRESRKQGGSGGDFSLDSLGWGGKPSAKKRRGF